ncbi:hypothetical protein ACIBBD_17620 [Streptomyces sp. NPDC051315]|uniref:hypothetical protein n=1 Tax=Streptomyces sp. NPDC051315 TaxID=3365650 RepID=UPI003796FE58
MTDALQGWARLEGCRRLVAETGVPLLGVDFTIEEATGDRYVLEAGSMPGYEGYDIRADGAHLPGRTGLADRRRPPRRGPPGAGASRPLNSC